MIPSKYQSNIYDVAKNTQHNIAVLATAGSGKTSTIIEIAKLLPSYKKSIFLAFNKSIVEELRSRIPSHIECSTIHSMGFSSLIRYYRLNFRVNQYKSLMFIEEKIKQKKQEGFWDKKVSKKEKWVYCYNLVDIIDLVRMNNVNRDIESIDQICSYYDIIPIYGEVEDSIDIMNRIDQYNLSFDKKNNNIDFTDMVSLPALNKKIHIEQYDNVFVDEAQDLNKIQHAFIERLVKPKGRLILVGDKRQAIYSFAGADSNSFDLLANRPNTQQLPLSISYRCAKNIVLSAKEIYDEIEPFEHAEEGEVRGGSFDEIKEGDMVICRNNRPLIQLFFMLLEENKPAYIYGKDLEKALLSLVSKVRKFDKDKAIEKLEGEIEKVKKQLEERGVEKKNITTHPKYVSIYEKVKAITIIAEHCQHTLEIEQFLETMFADKAIRLMTIHKSKGLESERVFIIERFEGKDLIPSPYATQPWQITQEMNLKFVAYTRAKKQLIILPDLK